MARANGSRLPAARVGALTAAGLVAAGAAFGPTSAAPVSAAGPASGPAKVYACYSDKTDELFRLDYPTHKACASGQTLISWTVQGPQGASGAQGQAGPQGATGTQGQVGAQGTMGPAGPQGSLGPQGVRGAQGATGAPGQTGAQGSTGAKGVRGAPGAQGAQGPSGGSGAQGAQGPRGSTGAQGVQGPQGSTGKAGARGAQGTLQPTVVENGDRQPATGSYAQNTSRVVGSVKDLPAGPYALSATVTTSAKGSAGVTRCFVAAKAADSSTVFSATPEGWVDASVGDATMAGVVQVSAAHPTIEVACRGSATSGWAVTAVDLLAMPVESVTIDGVRGAGSPPPPASRVGARPHNLFDNPATSPKQAAGRRSPGAR
jgi:hypothetical protein